MSWKRTSDNEYPEQDQKCLIFFAYTGYSISTFEWDRDKEMAVAMGCDPETFKIAIFSDEGGFLGDEDLLWMPIEEYGAKKLKKKPLPIPTEAYIEEHPRCKKYLEN